MSRYILILCSVLLLGGCSGLRGGTVPFGSQIQKPRPASQDVIDIYFDRVGDLYPDRSVVVDDRDMKNVLTLKNYFSMRGACASTANGKDAAAPCPSSGAGDPGKPVSWDEMQDAQFRKTAQMLADRLKNTQKPLVVLIHGFRVIDADAIYDDVRNRMDTHLANRPKPVYLQVHWDGLHSPTPVGVWGKAQVNGFLVGLALRRVLADVPPEVPVRVMTHSSGAFVLSATLGDPAAVFAKRTFDSDEFAGFRANAAGSPRYPIPRSRDLRAALIVPATPAWSYAGGIGPDGHAHPGMALLHK